MNRKATRATFTPEFRHEIAMMVIEGGQKPKAVSDTTGIGKSTIERWVRELKKSGYSAANPKAPITADQARIRELEREVKKLREDKDILKKVLPLLILDSPRYMN